MNTGGISPTQRRMTQLSDLIPDKRNANKGTKRGADAVTRSLRDFGAGRSVLVDRNGNVLAGNQTVKAAGAAGIDQNVILVETDGSQLVVVKRTDLDLTTRRPEHWPSRTIAPPNWDWNGTQRTLPNFHRPRPAAFFSARLNLPRSSRLMRYRRRARSRNAGRPLQIAIRRYLYLQGRGRPAQSLRAADQPWP